MLNLKKMSTYEFVKRSNVSKDTKIISIRMIYKLKKNLLNNIIKYKTRCVAKSYNQRHEIDFFDTYAAVVKTMSYKIIFALAAYLNLKCEQMNVIIAYLNSHLKEVIYAKPSESYRIKSYV